MTKKSWKIILLILTCDGERRVRRSNLWHHYPPGYCRKEVNNIKYLNCLIKQKKTYRRKEGGGGMYWSINKKLSELLYFDWLKVVSPSTQLGWSLRGTHRTISLCDYNNEKNGSRRWYQKLFLFFFFEKKNISIFFYVLFC